MTPAWYRGFGLNKLGACTKSSVPACISAGLSLFVVFLATGPLTEAGNKVHAKRSVVWVFENIEVVDASVEPQDEASALKCVNFCFTDEAAWRNGAQDERGRIGSKHYFGALLGNIIDIDGVKQLFGCKGPDLDAIGHADSWGLPAVKNLNFHLGDGFSSLPIDGVVTIDEARQTYEPWGYPSSLIRTRCINAGLQRLSALLGAGFHGSPVLAHGVFEGRLVIRQCGFQGVNDTASLGAQGLDLLGRILRLKPKNHYVDDGGKRDDSGQSRHPFAIGLSRLDVDHNWRRWGAWFQWLMPACISLCSMYCGIACMARTGGGEWWYCALRIDRMPALWRMLTGMLFVVCSMFVIFHVLSQMQAFAMNSCPLANLTYCPFFESVAWDLGQCGRKECEDVAVCPAATEHGSSSAKDFGTTLPGRAYGYFGDQYLGAGSETDRTSGRRSKQAAQQASGAGGSRKSFRPVLRRLTGLDLANRPNELWIVVGSKPLPND
jgi:hypothetical protein